MCGAVRASWLPSWRRCWLTWQEVKRPTVEELLKVPSIVQQLWALSDADPSLELSMSGAPQRSRHSASSGSDEG